MKRKFLGIVLATAMCISLVPATAFAEETTETVLPDEPVVEEQQPETEPQVPLVPELELEPGVVQGELEEAEAQQPEGVTSAQVAAAPEPAADLQAEKLSAIQISLKWVKAEGATKYAIYRKQPGGVFTKIKTVGNVDTFVDTGIVPGITYSYKVLSFNGGVRGAYSNVAQVATTLEAPEAVEAKRVAHDAITVSWQAVDCATKYVVYRSTEPDEKNIPFKKLMTVNSPALTYEDTGLETGVTYYYKILPFVNHTRGKFSEPVSAKTTMDKLTGLMAVINEEGFVSVSWDETLGADSYKVYRSEREDGGSKLVATVQDGTTYVDVDAVEGMIYYYKVAPQCGDMNGGAVGPVSIKAVNVTLFNNIVSVGRSLKGIKYRRGGKTPAGFDCSGYVWYVLNNAGFNIGYLTSSDWRSANYPTYYSLNQAEAGDILCFSGHVGIYIGNGMMLDCGGDGVREVTIHKPYWSSTFRCIKRIM